MVEREVMFLQAIKCGANNAGDQKQADDGEGECESADELW